MKKKTREWVRKAESDFGLANEATNSARVYHDQVCFFCQQSAEKYLKALLEESALPIPKTHNLIGLYTLLHSHQRSLGPTRRGLLYLSDFAVDFRYPGNWASKRQALAALRWAARIRQQCRSLLGLKPPRKKLP